MKYWDFFNIIQITLMKLSNSLLKLSNSLILKNLDFPSEFLVNLIIKNYLISINK